MKISDILDICNGNLVNFPFISSIEGIATQPNRVKRGDLFFALDTKDIESAVNKGAYAIIFDKPTQVSDYEIAWIKVDSVKSAIDKFIRYEIANNPKKFFLVNSFQYELIEQIVPTKQICLLGNDSLENYHSIKNSDNIFISKEKEYLEFIASKYDEIDQIETSEFELTSSSTFELAFIFNRKLYEKIKIAALFADDLFKVVKFLTIKSIDFNLSDIETFSHFHPIYVDSSFNEKEYGKSDRVLIFEPDETLVDKEIKYLSKENSWAKSIVIVNSSTHTIDFDNIHIAKNNKNIFDILKRSDFNFALIVGKTKESVDKYLNKGTITQPTLFDI
jgi:ferrochelatase